MTAPARISQADMERATKAVKAAEFERARIVFDLAHSKIEVIVGESETIPSPTNGWDDE